MAKNVKARMTRSEATLESLRAEEVGVISGLVGSSFMDMLDIRPWPTSATFQQGLSRQQAILHRAMREPAARSECVSLKMDQVSVILRLLPGTRTSRIHLWS